jgi:uncharacterized protein
MNRTRLTARSGLVLAGAVLFALATAAPASAHVHADGSATVGGYAVVTFRVPTESDTASTTSIRVTLPPDAQFASVSTLAKPGWTVELDHADLPTPTTNEDGEKIATYVTAVTWTATAGGIKPGQFDTFAISLGPVPAVHELVFPTRQTYSDGTTVDWSEIAEGNAEPERPAPSVPVAADSPAPSPVANSGPDPLGVAGVVLGGLGVVLAALALVRAAGRPGQ